jgi:transposase-like protein
LADKQDVSVATLIDSAVREHGTVRKAARSLGVSPASIYGWMSRHGYKVERRVYRSERAS